MADELVFYTNPMSRGAIARWMLEEVNQPYETKVLDYGTTMKSPEYLSINPMGKVPAITHNGVVVTEAAAICAYLADAFPQAGLKPERGDKALAPYYRWMFYGAGPVEQAITNRSMGFVIPADKAAMAGYGSFEAVMDVMEHAVTQHEYIAGDRFTAADVYFGAQVGWGLMFGSIEDRPAFKTYWSRLEQRPAWQRKVEKDNALMPAQAQGQG